MGSRPAYGWVIAPPDLVTGIQGIVGDCWSVDGDPLFVDCEELVEEDVAAVAAATAAAAAKGLKCEGWLEWW